MIGGDEEAVKKNTGVMRSNNKRRWITLHNKVWGDSRICSPFSPVHSEPAKTLIVAKGHGHTILYSRITAASLG